jgi:ATP-binding cassette subfamily B protein
MRINYGYFEEDQLGKPYDLGLIKRLFPYIYAYRYLFLLSIVLTTAITALDLTLPYLTKIAIDRYIVQDTPPIESLQVDQDDEGAKQQRHFYVVDMRSPKVKKIMKRYPSSFERRWPFARISYEALAKLSEADLADLRSRDYAGVTRIALIFLGIIMCHFMCSFGHAIIIEYAGQSIIYDLRRILFDHLQHRSIAFFTKNPVGRLVTRVTSDVQNLHEFLTSIITVFFKDVFLLIGITTVLLVIHWQLALICFLMLPIIFLTTSYFSRLARDVFRDLRIKIAQINTRLQETIDGIRVIQLFLQERKNYERFRTLNHQNYLSEMRQVNILAVFMPAIELLGAITTALIIWYGGRRVLADDLTLGALVAFISYMGMFFRPIRDLAEKYNIMQSAMASSERIFLLLDTQDETPEPAIPFRMPKIETVSFDNVSFAYTPGEWVLRDISFMVRRGETVAIVGPTGAGKSTLVHLLERFYDPTEGKIRISGIDIRQIPQAELRERMALITQDVFLFADSIRNNITEGNPRLTPEHLEKIVAASNIGRLIQGLPNGVDTLLTEGGRTLSNGERQLIAFGRALARNPEILILDEATSSVDTETERLIQGATIKLMQNRTAIVVAHRLSTIRHADRIVVLHKGRIREVGSHDELITRKGLYYQLYQSQRLFDKKAVSRPQNLGEYH